MLNWRPIRGLEVIHGAKLESTLLFYKINVRSSCSSTIFKWNRNGIRCSLGGIILSSEGLHVWVAGVNILWVSLVDESSWSLPKSMKRASATVPHISMDNFKLTKRGFMASCRHQRGTCPTCLCVVMVLYWCLLHCEHHKHVLSVIGVLYPVVPQGFVWAYIFRTSSKHYEVLQKENLIKWDVLVTSMFNVINLNHLWGHP